MKYTWTKPMVFRKSGEKIISTSITCQNDKGVEKNLMIQIYTTNYKL